MAAVQTLPDGWRGLRWPAKVFQAARIIVRHPAASGAFLTRGRARANLRTSRRPFLKESAGGTERGNDFNLLFAGKNVHDGSNPHVAIGPKQDSGNL